MSRRHKTIAFVVVGVVVAAFVVNLIYQVVRKPAELFYPVSGVLTKTPAETWQQYGPIFRAHATAVMSPELLAAIAQVESEGDPLARTRWRWRLTQDPFQVYRPASSAVGMYQMTDGMYREAKRYCIRDGAVVEDGAWNDWGSCWFNSLYFRTVPSHAVEMTAAFLERRVEEALARRRISGATLEQKRSLAALIHLCGAGAADAYVRRGFRLAAGQRCGEHDPRAYLARVGALRREFARLSALG